MITKREADPRKKSASLIANNSLLNVACLVNNKRNVKTDQICKKKPVYRKGHDSLAIPAPTIDSSAFVILAVRDEGFFDIESFNETLPSRPVKAENCLMVGDTLVPLFLNLAGFIRA